MNSINQISLAVCLRCARDENSGARRTELAIQMLSQHSSASEMKRPQLRKAEYEKLDLYA